MLVGRRSSPIPEIDEIDAFELTERLLAADSAACDPTASGEELHDAALTSGEEMDLRAVLRTGGWSMASVLFGLNLVDEFDRIALQVLAPDIQRTFDISDGALTAINGIGGVLILVGAIPFGLLADRSVRTRVVAISSVVWSVFALAGGLATNVWQFVATRTFNGIGKGNGPVQSSLLADQYPIAGRGRIFALHNLANPIGGLLGPALAGGVATLAGGAAGWRWSLIVLSLPCLALSVAAFTLREPRRGAYEAAAALGDTEGERDEGSQSISLSAGFERLKKISTFFYLMAALGVLGLTVFGAPTIFNLLLERQFGLDALGRGFVSSGIAAGSAVGAVIGGRVSDRLFRDDAGRILVLVGRSLALFAVLYPLGLYMPNVVLLTVVHAVAFAFVLIPFVSISAVLAAVVPPRLRGLGFAVVGLYLFLVGGLIGGILLGTASDRLGERSALAIFVAPSCLVAAIVIAYAARFVRRDVSLVVEEIREEREERLRLASAAAGDVPAIQVRNLDFSYGQVQVLFGIDLDVREGEVLALLGTNGAGKSTLLRVISGLAMPDRGVVRFRGHNITYATPPDRVALGLVQMPGGRSVFPTLTVEENLIAGTYSFVWDTDRASARIEVVLELFPRLRERLDQPAGTMSGGEQQMLALAKALLLDPKVLIVDELSLGLAPRVVQELLAVVEQLKARGITIVLVEQSVNVALSIADRAVFMEKGQIRFEGTASELIERDDLIRAVFLGSEGG